MHRRGPDLRRALDDRPSPAPRLLGFGLYRAAGAAGIDCQVIAPSKTPRAAGERNKSDRRDAELLLRQLMAGALTPIAVPSATFEAARDLARAREQVRADLMRCRHRVSKLLLRHGRMYDRKAWTQTHTTRPRTAERQKRPDALDTPRPFMDDKRSSI
jgi:transposase